MRLLCFIIFLTGVIKSQTNLVFNGGFETYSVCPNSNSQIDYAQGWYGAWFTPDYFNACCSPSVGFSTPTSALGYQMPFEGQAYSGFEVYDNATNLRECISSQLLMSLVIGQKYFISLRVNLCDLPNSANYGIDKLGVLFSTQKYTPSSPPPVKNFAHVYTNVVITDSVNWTLIKGSLVADSAYQFINLSNFFDLANTDTSSRNPNSTTSLGSKYSYYFIDDIRVSTDSLFGLGYVGVKEIENISDKIKVYPNPAGEEAYIESELYREGYGLRIRDVLGRALKAESWLSEKQVIDLSELSTGVYYLEITDKERTIAVKKIVKE